MIGQLPKSVEVHGEEYALRTDFRDVLKVLCAFNDPDLERSEKVFVCLVIMYPSFVENGIPKEDFDEAFSRAVEFINGGYGKSKNHPGLMDWEQDASIMFPAINKVAGFEIRTCEYLHWWTFLGYFMEITDGVFSHVMALRMKRAKGKKLEKWELEFWNANKDLCTLKTKLSEEEQAEKDQLNALLG